ncbi:MAG: recombinase family protein [Clostridia bacterium]
MNAVIYARYSSENQREESIEGQLRECQRYAESKGLTIINTYIDRALSAKTANRPAFQKMIKDSAKAKFEGIIVWKLDRFARNRYDSATYKAQLRKNNVRVLSATEAISDDATGILLESLLEGFAEYYSAELSEKVTRGHHENALKCKFNGGSITFGFKIDENQMYQLDPLNAPCVLEAFTLYNDGYTMKEICEKLYTKGIRNSKGNEIRNDTMKKILRNRRHIGEYIYDDVVIENGIPDIVPRELFLSV